MPPDFKSFSNRIHVLEEHPLFSGQAGDSSEIELTLSFKRKMRSKNAKNWVLKFYQFPVSSDVELNLAAEGLRIAVLDSDLVAHIDRVDLLAP